MREEGIVLIWGYSLSPSERHGSGSGLQAWQQAHEAAGSHLSGPGNRKEGIMEPRRFSFFPIFIQFKSPDHGDCRSALHSGRSCPLS